jgi:hypothetical protein
VYASHACRGTPTLDHLGIADLVRTQMVLAGCALGAIIALRARLEGWATGQLA